MDCKDVLPLSDPFWSAMPPTVHVVDQLLHELHGGATALVAPAPFAAPISRVHVFDRVDTAGSQQWEKSFETHLLMPGNVRPIIDDDVRRPHFLDDLAQELGV